MKKRICFSVLFPFLASSCSTSFAESINGHILAFSNSSLYSYVEIQSAKELDSIARYDDALIIVSREGCSACQKTFRELVPYIEERHYLIYTVDSTYYWESYSSPDNSVGEFVNLYPKIAGTPTFLFYRDGRLVEAHSGSYPEGTLAKELDSIFLDYGLNIVNDFLPTGRGSFVSDKAEKIDSLGYGTNTLENLLSRDEKVSVLYSWRRCQDCHEYKEEILYPYLQTRDNDTPLYVYELDGYYQLKRSDNPDWSKEGLMMFSQFSAQFKLDLYPVKDSEGNTAGVVPTLITYFPGGKADLSVYRNDLNPRINEDKTLSYSQSFYPEILELKSKTIVQDDDSSTYAKALEELKKQAGEIERQHCQDYLKEYL